MKAFILLLLFGKSILLTPNLIDINEIFTIELEEPITAINSGASIKIDVTKNIKYHEKQDISEFRNTVQQFYKPNTIQAILIESNGNKTILKYEGHMMFNTKETLLDLSSEENISTEKKFVKVQIVSISPINNVLIYWNNYKK